MLSLEQYYLGLALRSTFGYDLVQLGITPYCSQFAQSCTTYQWQVTDELNSTQIAQLVADMQMLPWLNNQIDAVVLPNTLHFHPNATAVLQEAVRVLTPGKGSLFIVGINPYSRLGIKLTWRSRARFIYFHVWSIAKIKACLRQLDCQVIQVWRFGLVVNKKKPLRFSKLDKLFPWFCNEYIVVAKKQVLMPSEPLYKRLWRWLWPEQSTSPYLPTCRKK